MMMRYIVYIFFNWKYTSSADVCSSAERQVLVQGQGSKPDADNEWTPSKVSRKWSPVFQVTVHVDFGFISQDLKLNIESGVLIIILFTENICVHQSTELKVRQGKQTDWLVPAGQMDLYFSCPTYELNLWLSNTWIWGYCTLMYTKLWAYKDNNWWAKQNTDLAVITECLENTLQYIFTYRRISDGIIVYILPH